MGPAFMDPRGLVLPLIRPEDEEVRPGYFCGQLILQRACWDFQSSGGCSRLGCKWMHCSLDDWQMAWLRFQRFCFGGQLTTFDDLDSLVDAVHRVFQEEARLAAETPPAAMAAKQIEALSALRVLGYRFEVPTAALPAADDSASGEHRRGTSGGYTERMLLLESVRELAAKAIPGAEVLPVGSFAWGVDTDGSDLDVVVLPPPSSVLGENSGQAILDCFLATLQRLQSSGEAPQGLQDAEWALYGQTSVPVLTLRAEANGQLMGIDICAFGQLGSVRDAILFRHALAVNPELCMVLQLLKRWLRARAVPSCREGGFPQVFWMRLAARCYQQITSSGSTKGSGMSSDPCTADAMLQDQASTATPRSTEEEATQGSTATPRSIEDERESEARQHLRSLCARWSLALPAWGEPLNLQGEDPCGAAKRLATGVFGATALLCMHELRNLANAQRVEDLPPVEPHSHLVPAQAGFWAAFLIPQQDSDRQRGPAELIAAWVGHSSGEADSVRHSAFVKEGLGCNSMLQPPGCAAAYADARLACEHRYVSRRDTEWVMVATAANEASEAPLDTDDSAAEENTSGPPAGAQRHLALAPPHFICLLEGDPARSRQANAKLLSLRSHYAEPQVAASLPPAYSLHRYSSKLLLRFRQKNGKKEQSGSEPTFTPTWGLQKR